MRFVNRFGLSLMLIVIYSQLTWLMPDDFTQLQRGILHIVLMVGYALFLIQSPSKTDD